MLNIQSKKLSWSKWKGMPWSAMPLLCTHDLLTLRLLQLPNPLWYSGLCHIKFSLFFYNFYKIYSALLCFSKINTTCSEYWYMYIYFLIYLYLLIEAAVLFVYWWENWFLDLFILCNNILNLSSSQCHPWTQLTFTSVIELWWKKHSKSFYPIYNLSLKITHHLYIS